MRFESGYLSPYFVTDSERMECVYEDAYILIHGGKIFDGGDLISLLKHVARPERPLLVISAEIDTEALASLVFNKVSGTLKCVVVKAPAFGDQRKALMEEIAARTTGRLLPEDFVVKNVTLMDFGRASRIVVNEHTTTIEPALESKI
jgi:chaperonin GroEL